MAKVKAAQKVYRAEFLNWIQTTTAGDHVERGAFVVEVSRWPYLDGWWVAMVNGDRGRVLCFTSSAAKCRMAARRHFERRRTDWFEGEKVDGQWRPLADQAPEVK